MIKKGSFILDFIKLSKIVIDLKLSSIKIPNYYFQLYPSILGMSNVNDPENLNLEKKDTNAPDENMKHSKKHRYTKEERKQDRKARLKLKQETKVVGFHNNDSLKQTQYYFENGLRKVYPYFFGWNTTAKERWLLIEFMLLNIQGFFHI